MKPVLTLALISYNQEKYIREAFDSALAQTYSPLEIIVSDDCSSDDTFRIIREIAKAYCGPHTIVLNQNHTNLGIGGNVNRVMELSRGELVIAVAGDDISLPERSETIYKAWEESGREATSIFSSHIIISKGGCIESVGGVREIAVENNLFSILNGDLCTFASRVKPVVNGCTHAWSPLLFQYFGPLRCDLEDLVLSFRTLAIGRMVYVNEPLVKYRRHGDNVSFLGDWDDTESFEQREKRLRWVDEKSIRAYENMLFDLDTLYRKGRITEAYAEQVKVVVRKMLSFYRIERQMMCANLFRRLTIVASLLVGGEVRLSLRFSFRALPKRIYRRLYILRESWRAWRGEGKLGAFRKSRHFGP